jgi:hypothetical protein
MSCAKKEQALKFKEIQMGKREKDGSPRTYANEFYGTDQ